MRNIMHVLPCGAVYRFKQHEYSDMAERMTNYIFANIDREDINFEVNGDNYGRKRKPWAAAYYKKVMNTVWKHIVEHILESDRVLIPHKKTPSILYIGQIPDNPKRIAKRRKKKQVRFATNDVRYGVVLDGFDHSYYFRMSFRNRCRLYERIKAGQNYH